MCVNEFLGLIVMLNFAALFLPSFVCLIWGGMLLFTPHKGVARRVLTILLLIAAAYFFIDAFYVGQLEDAEDYAILARLDMVSQFITLALVPFLVLYIIVAQGKMFSWPLAYLTLVPCLCQGVASCVVYLLMGIDNAVEYLQSFDMLGAFPPEFDTPIYHAHNILCHTIYNLEVALEVLLCLAYLVYVYVRQQGNKEIRSFLCLSFVLLLFCAFRILLGRNFLVMHSGLSSVLSAILALDIFFMSHIACGIRTVQADKKSVMLSDNVNRVNSRFSQEETVEEDIKEEAPVVIEHIPVKETSVVREPSKPKNLLESFIVYMANQQPYLDPDLTVQEVCEELHTNRTYISELMADNFKMSFRDYVGLLRISAAKKLLRDDPNRTLEDIAADSGFSSSSQFVKKFKEITGTTPRAWLSDQL